MDHSIINGIRVRIIGLIGCSGVKSEIPLSLPLTLILNLTINMIKFKIRRLRTELLPQNNIPFRYQLWQLKNFTIISYTVECNK